MGGRHLKVAMSVLAYQWFNRAVAVWCLLLGLSYWVRLIGYYKGELWRFDLMPPHWQVAAVVLAVLFPFAASGLWMLASWGPVIWFICAAAETIMYAGFPELYGERFPAVLGHGLTLTIFLAFRVVFFLEHRRRRDAG
jgi:hypothetical protein